MFTLDVNDKRYKVSFSHFPPGKDLRTVSDKGYELYQLYSTKENFYYGTICLINNLSDGISSVGFAKLHPKDFGNFDKSKGRMVSFEQVLVKLFPNDRLTRRLFWATYHRIISEQRLRNEAKKLAISEYWENQNRDWHGEKQEGSIK